MKYFRFEIPLNADGTRISYSPGWHGVMPNCPEKVTVVLYNDKEGYGIAYTEDAVLPKEVKALTKTEYDKTLASVKTDAAIYVDGAKTTDGIYKGADIANRKEWQAEAIDVR